MEAHKHDARAAQFGETKWELREDGISHCSFCGSASPADAAKAISAGGAVTLADPKYGWPHKAYIQLPKPLPLEDVVVDGIVYKRHPATMLKFYTEHLQDANPEDRKVIERAMGLNFTFEGGRVAWVPFQESVR